MKVTASSEHIRRCVTTVYAAIDPRADGIWSKIRVRCINGSLLFQGGQDGLQVEAFIRKEDVETDPGVEWDVLVAADRLKSHAEALKNMVVLGVEKGELVIASDRSRFRMAVSDTNAYRDIPDYVHSEEESVYVQSADWTTAMRYTMFAIPRKNVDRDAITGVCVAMRKDRAELVTTDNTKLALHELRLVSKTSYDAMIPVRALQVMETQTRLVDGFWMRIPQGEGRAYFHLGSATVVTSLLTGSRGSVGIPAYQALLDFPKPVRLVVNTAALLEAMKSVKSCLEKGEVTLVLKMSDGRIRVVARTHSVSRGYSDVDCDYTGTDFAVAIHADDFIEGLKRCVSPSVEIDCGDSETPIQMRLSDDSKYIMMPRFVPEYTE